MVHTALPSAAAKHSKKQHIPEGADQCRTANTLTMNTMTANTVTANSGNQSPTSDSSMLGGYPHMRRLVVMLINEFYRKREISFKSVAKHK